MCACMCVCNRERDCSRFIHLRVRRCSTNGTRHGVNFINILSTNFLYERRFGSFFSSYMYVEKAAKAMFVQKTGASKVDEIDG